MAGDRRTKASNSRLNSTKAVGHQLNLFEDSGWPPHARFPSNSTLDRVKKPIWDDLLYSCSPLIITGYTSLDVIVEFLAVCHRDGPAQQHIRLVLGHEPVFIRRPSNYNPQNYSFSQEVVDYWLEQGISLYQSAQVLMAIEMLEQGKVEARTSKDEFRPVHAKIYVGDHAATLGSSNFSRAGLSSQIEGNARFTIPIPVPDDGKLPLHSGDRPDKGKRNLKQTVLQEAETKRYEETCQLAESIWQISVEYTNGLINLLKRLLHCVRWEEALGRASAEVLEGKWAEKYTRRENEMSDAPPLWPSQTQGIAQALWVLEHSGSVLVADATGSGKTRLGAQLINAVVERIWGSGRIRHSQPVLVCPAAVMDSWNKAVVDCSHAVQMYSDGILSRSSTENKLELNSVLRKAQVLAVDEAHRYVNRSAQRTRQLFDNMADYTLLFTATPINKGVNDLLALIELLGADNFEDDVIEVFEKVLYRLRRGSRSGIKSSQEAGKNSEEAVLTPTILPDERYLLRHAIQQFTVRRTKAMLNELIETDPEKYCDFKGRLCRYPHHEYRYYSCNEPVPDQELARQIRDVANSLQGLINLEASLQVSDLQRKQGVTDAQYLLSRLKGAKGLAVYKIMSCLRSSRLAVFEHICGSAQAYRQLKGGKAKAGVASEGMLKKLERISGKVPENFLVNCEVPKWLSDPLVHQQLCQEEIAIYKTILDLVERLSDGREQAKVDLLVRLLRENPRLIAFDSHLITLAHFEQRLQDYAEIQERKARIIVAVGGDRASRKQLKGLMHQDATEVGIALCSDSMSEGLNLQGASAAIHLDMPSVVRLAEQRIGRIDRMDSPHPVIASYWPTDSVEFALKTDEQFFARLELVEDLLGSNVELHPQNKKVEVVKPEELIEELEHPEVTRTRLEWEQISDAFEPVRSLVSGPNFLVPPSIYEQVRNSKVSVFSSVSAVNARHPWAFLAISATRWHAPHWVYFDSTRANPLTNLEEISQHLRANLADQKNLSRDYDQEAADLLKTFLNNLRKSERLLLSRKKQRALEEMEFILNNYSFKAKREGDLERQKLIESLLHLLSSNLENEEISEYPVDKAIDLANLAECWLDLIRPAWYKRLTERRKGYRPLRLRDIRSELLSNPLDNSRLQSILSQENLWINSLDRRIAAGIVGVPATVIDNININGV